MTVDELRRLVTLLGDSQGRTLTDETIDVWWDALQDLDGALAYDALRWLIRESTGFITPAVIRQTCQQIAAERIAAASKDDVKATPPSGLSDEEYLRWLRTWRDAVSTGRSPRDAETAALAAVGRGEIEQRDRPAPTFALPSATAQGDVIEGTIIRP